MATFLPIVLLLSELFLPLSKVLSRLQKLGNQIIQISRMLLVERDV
jgi:hypothetical protein